MANALSKVQGLPYFNDLFGNALDVGNVYIGLPNTDPRQNPITVYYDEAQTVPVAQPIRVLEGRLTKTGSVAEIFVNPPYSIYVEDQRGAQVYYLASVDDPVVNAIGALTTITTPNIAGLRLINSTQNKTVNVLSYYNASGLPDGGGGTYVFDATDTTTPDNGGTVIVGLNNARWKLDGPSGRVRVKQFGAKGDGTPDDTAAITAAKTFAYAQTVAGTTYPTPWEVIFDAGVYCYTTSPNWAASFARVTAVGYVVLRNTGTGNAVIIDGGATGNPIQDFTFGSPANPFVIESPTGAGHGIFARSLNVRTEINAVVRGAGVASAGLLTNWCVLTTFNVQVNPYQTSWYNDGTGAAKPEYGFILQQRGTGEQTSYCTFINPVANACQYGFYLDGALGNVLLGGDAQNNTTAGAILTAAAINNKFIGTDFEENLVDVQCAGSYNEFDVDTGSNGVAGGFRFVAGSIGNKLKGGTHDQVAVDAGTGNFIGGITTQRGLSGNLQVIDNGTKTSFDWYWKAQQATPERGPIVTTPVAVGASPFLYTNNTGRVQWAAVEGGTVGNTTVVRNGLNVAVFGATNSYFPLQPGAQVTITYSALPTLTITTE